MAPDIYDEDAWVSLVAPRVCIEELMRPSDGNGGTLVIGLFQGRWARFRPPDSGDQLPVTLCDRWESQRLAEASKYYELEYGKPYPNGAQLIVGWHKNGAAR